MYTLFQQKMSIYPVFSIKDIEKEFPNFDKKNLVNWQKKGYINKIRNNFYAFAITDRNEDYLYFVANKIYAPSYISFESALSYYAIIPEGVYTITSASTSKTNSFTTPIGTFTYKHLKPNLFFGYSLIKFQNQSFKMAVLEKVILDYLYLDPSLTSVESFHDLRWNKDILSQMDINLFENYQLLFNSKALNTRVNHFLKYMHA